MVDHIHFNNKNSYSDFGLYLTERPAIPLTLEDYESIAIEGRSGALIRKLDTYKDKKIVCKFSMLSNDNFARNIDNIIQWLNYITDNSLIFSFDDTRMYKVKAITVSENIQEILKFYGKFEVNFICEPFKYPISENTLTETSLTFNLNSVGTVKSEPYIKITGTGDITLSVNSIVTTFTGVEDYIEIDSQYLLCYKGATNEMSKMNGKFPIFNPGTNPVVLTGTVTQIDMIPRTRYL